MQYNPFHITLTHNFCDDIIKTGDSLNIKNAKIKDGELSTIEEATIADGNSANRSSKISWLDDKELQTTLSHFIQSANRESNWNFSLKEFESLQYTIYNKGDHYNWHTDNHVKPYKNNTIRKLSFTLCLNDEYEGGDFEICDPHPEPDLSKTSTFTFKKGSIIVFPSHVWHRVKPVTKGIRKSLVGWIVGTPFI